MEHLAVIGTYSMNGSKGIYSIAERNGALQLLDTCPAHDVGYMSLNKDHTLVFATRESMIFHGHAAGGIGIYEITNEGKLGFLSESVVGGQMPCYISTSKDGRQVYVSCLMSGTLSVHDVLENSLTLNHTLAQPKREGILPSIHCAAELGSEDIYCLLNVTQNAVFLYSCKDNREVCGLKLTGDFSSRPRQFVSQGNFIYVATETGHGLFVLRYLPEESRLILLQRVNLNPDGYKGKSRGSCIKLSPDGKLLIASVRYTDVLTLFYIEEDGTVSHKSCIRTKGKSPRDFDISPDGNFLLAGMQGTNTLECYRINAKDLTLQLCSELADIPTSTCVRYIK